MRKNLSSYFLNFLSFLGLNLPLFSSVKIDNEVLGIEYLKQLQKNDNIFVGNSPFGSLNEITTEVTEHFFGLFSAYGLIKAISD